ncbi:MAG TPA: sulfotransferase, partial [Gammaproteobacteria bacterium]|nr:sulfotransferase [Gammaproteobacteria bacterium]
MRTTTLAAAGLRTGIATLNRMGSGLAACGIHTPSLDGAALRRVAMRRAGLSDFGQWPIDDPFERLVRSYHDDAGLTTLGRITVRELLVSLLENLLYLEEDRRGHPALENERIAAPVFITGLPRTGTTLLHGLLTEDPDNRVPLTWEVMYPARHTAAELAAVRRRTDARLEWANRLAPAF